MKTVFKLLQIPAIALLLVSVLYSSSFASSATGVEIYENWNKEKGVIKFAVEKTSGFNDIIGFAVGNDYGFSFDLQINNDELKDWVGVEIAKPDGGWGFNRNAKAVKSSNPVDAFDLSSFNSYDSVLLFYGTTTPLLSDLTGGFIGMVDPTLDIEPNSAIFLLGNDKPIVGNTVSEVSSTPIPGAAILFLSGLAGLVGLRRRS